MNDKTLMEDLLNNSKGACSLYMHGTIESATPKVLDTFFETLSDAKKKKTIFIACDAEILKYCTFRTTVPLLIFTVPPA